MCLLAVSLLQMMSLGAATEVQRFFDVESGPAAHTLKEFSRQGEADIIFDSRRLDGIVTQRVVGLFSPSEALESLLKGTGISYKQDMETGAFAVFQQKASAGSGTHKTNKIPAMNNPLKTITAAGAMLLAAVSNAQINTPGGVSDNTVRSDDEEVIELSPFMVTATKSSRYQPTESVSSGRIATNIFDTAQSVSVVPQELIEDAGTFRIFDAIKYTAGASDSTLPGAIDRITLRGFQTDNGYLDNFFFWAQANIDPAIIERIEIVKGPNAILNPTGPAGGIVNVVSKSPLFTARNQIKLQVGQYDSNRLEADFTGPIGSSEKLAYRLVLARHDSEGYHDNTFVKSTVIMPMLSWQISPTSKFTAKYFYYNWESPPFLGYPIDPVSTTTNKAVMLAGVPRTRTLQEKSMARYEDRHQFLTSLTAELSPNLSMRLAVNALYAYASNQQILNSGNRYGDRNPLTGNWETGVSFSQTAPFESTPLPPPTRVFNRTGSLDWTNYHYYNLQNDYVYIREFDSVVSTTLAGFTLDYANQKQKRRNSPLPALDIDNPIYGASPDLGPINYNQVLTNLNSNFFVAQQLKMLNERLFLNANLTWLAVESDNVNRLEDPAVTTFNRTGNVSIFSWSVLGKIRDDFSVYFSASRNAAPVFLVGTPPSDFSFREGEQTEIGLRWQANEGRTVVSVAYYDISVNNFSFPNPAAVGAGNVANIPLFIFGSYTSEGFEVEFSSELNNRLTMIGNYSQSKYRNQFGVRQRGTADTSAALFLRYEFNPESDQSGWYGSMGFEYLGDRAGDFSSGLTAASTPNNPIYNQSTFYLPSRFIVNAGAGYRNGPWQMDIMVQNALDQEYLAASINRNLVITGAPINLKASVTYRF